MKCYFSDERVDFFSLLAGKLGDVSMIPLESGDLNDPDSIANSDAIIVGLRSSNAPGFQTRLAALEKLVLNPAGPPVVAFISHPDRAAILQAIGSGAYDCFVESQSLEELRIVLRRAAHFHELQRELHNLKAAVRREDGFGYIAGTSPKMIEVFTLARKVAGTDANVVLNGETGTGKELLARAIHENSLRAAQAFVPVACSSLPETLIEAELFGHEKGAFTGATSVRHGRFEAAGGGTIFLDEIGELSPALQVKLLRVLQERTFERLGSNELRTMKARVICATHHDLKALAHAGEFRADLYYRLNTIEIKLPPLRDRREDILVLAHLFLQKFIEAREDSVLHFHPAAICALKRYAWPGNVRELQHAIEHAVVVCDGHEIGVEHLPSGIVRRSDDSADNDVTPLEIEVRAFKRRRIQQMLADTGNNKVAAARALGISRSSLHRLLDELHIRSPQHCD